MQRVNVGSMTMEQKQKMETEPYAVMKLWLQGPEKDMLNSLVGQLKIPGLQNPSIGGTPVPTSGVFLTGSPVL